MAIIDLLDRPVAYHRVYRVITGSTVAAVMLSQAAYWQQVCDKSGCGDGHGWWWKDRTEWEQETGLSRSEQETARKRLVQIGVLEEKRRGVPARMWYRIDIQILEEKLQQYQQNDRIRPTSKRKPRQSVSKKPTFKEVRIQPFIPEITTETTHKNTTTLDGQKTTARKIDEAEIEQYITLVGIPTSLKKKNPTKYLQGIRERLTTQHGLNEWDYKQLAIIEGNPVADDAGALAAYQEINRTRKYICALPGRSDVVTSDTVGDGHPST